MTTEYIHVTEFLQTIFCFSILILIGQRFVMTWKGEDQQYLHLRLQELEQQIRWEKEHQKKSTPKMQPSPQTDPSQQAQPPQQPTLKTSLTDYQNDQTNRKMQNEEQAQQKSPYKRKSLTDLAKQNQEIKPKQLQIKDMSVSGSSRKQSIDSRQGEDRNRGITNELDRSNIMNQNHRYPSVPAYNLDFNEQFRKQVQTQMKLKIFTLIDTVFNQHLPILMSMLVMGILVESTYITSMICLFGYVLTHLLLKLKSSKDQIDNQINQPTFLSKFSLILPLLPKLWIFILFINYWADTQYSLV